MGLGTRGAGIVLALVGLMPSACTTYESAYEKAVYDDEPIYCYQSLAGADCYRRAYRRDDRRLISYYGPAPSKYSSPARPDPSPLQPPPDPPSGKAEAVPVAREAADVTTGPADGGETGAKDGFQWRTWLPLLSVAFGALQVVAAFVM